MEIDMPLNTETKTKTTLDLVSLFYDAIVLLYS